MSQPANVRVKMLATVGPTPTDKQRYDAGSIWTMTEDRALELSEAGEAQILGDVESDVEDFPIPDEE